MVSAPSFSGSRETTTTPAPAVDVSGACDVCQHPLRAHDAIASRFCRATTSQSLTRNCVCAA
jgi:hypothetical protein